LFSDLNVELEPLAVIAEEWVAEEPSPIPDRTLLRMKKSLAETVV
jgi:hypothetical protein